MLFGGTACVHVSAYYTVYVCVIERERVCVIVRERVCDSERTCVYVCVYMMHACAVFTLVMPVTARAGVLPTYIAKACIITLHIAQAFPRDTQIWCASFEILPVYSA